jgi:large subunit ribosomal protein L20
MTRSANKVAAKKRRKKILKLAKGYYGARSKLYTVAKNAVEKGLLYAYRDRKQKKRFFRSLWIQRINSAIRPYNMTYSKFIHILNLNNVKINRKSIAFIAMNHQDIFHKMVNNYSSEK